MTYIDPAIRAQLQAQYDTLQQQLAAANTAYTASLGNAEVQSYSLDTGEGKQSATRRKPAEIRIEITAIQREMAQLRQRLLGRGIVSMNLRRR